MKIAAGEVESNPTRWFSRRRNRAVGVIGSCAARTRAAIGDGSVWHVRRVQRRAVSRATTVLDWRVLAGGKVLVYLWYGPISIAVFGETTRLFTT